jgi:putative membrane protein insertion efficiency factor
MKRLCLWLICCQQGLAPFWRTLLGSSGPCCRFHPTCSEYAMEAIDRHGVIGGVSLAARRILRCHPWGNSGWDPVKEIS